MKSTIIGKVGVTLKGEYNPAVVYEHLDEVSNEGNSYISRIANNTAPLTDEDAWMLSAAKGDKGDKGDTGDVGPKGDKGDTGDVGPKGDKGDTGDVGPKGDKGDTGDVGPKGDKGDTGDVGPKGDKGDTGLSAYEYAVLGGYTGTEEEFKQEVAGIANSIKTTPQTLTAASKIQAQNNIGIVEMTQAEYDLLTPEEVEGLIVNIVE